MIRRVSRQVAETVLASGWMYLGRFIGLFWAVLLTREMGIAVYGAYAIAIAISVLITVPLDHYYVVRILRVGKGIFLGDRSTRLIGGVTLLVVGALLLQTHHFLSGFAIGKAGGEIAFNAAKSEFVRDGHPARAMGVDTARQLIGFGATAAYFLQSSNPTLPGIAAWTLVSFVPFLAWAGWTAWGHRPRRPEITARTAAIVGEAVGGAVYSQADIVVVGVFASETSAGYYAYGSLLIWSLAAVGQNYSYTFNERLRAADGHRSAGPAIRPSLSLSLGLGGIVAAVAVVMAIAGAPGELVWTFAILAVVTVPRTLSSIFTTVLAVQKRDRFRTVVTWISVAVKFALLLVVGRYGGPAAAAAFVVSDVVMTYAYGRAVHRPAEVGEQGRLP
jgi:O-antigen/teichoic acid export membrane protein